VSWRDAITSPTPRFPYAQPHLGPSCPLLPRLLRSPLSFKQLLPLLGLTLAACEEPVPRQEAVAAVAQAFYDQNHRRELDAFDGVSVRIVRPVLQRDVTVLGYVYALSFCAEVVDIEGHRGTSDLTYYYSDWPTTQHELMRRARPDSLRREHLATLFRVPVKEAEATYAQWAAETVEQFKALNLPHAFDAPPRYLRSLGACVSQEGHPILFGLANGVEVLYLPPDTDASLYWTQQKRRLHKLGPLWYWRTVTPDSATAARGLPDALPMRP
jgi:hypothetical protein